MTSWMRDADVTEDKESYLLGKTVDKAFERQGTMGQINAVEYDCTPESIFSSEASHQVDLQRKLQEDPLLAIKRQEIDCRKRVLDNPIKMRHIQNLISESKKKAKKSKKKKKKTKRRRASSSSSEEGEEETDLDALLLKKLQKFNQNQQEDEESDEESENEERESLKRKGGEEFKRPDEYSRMAKRSEKERGRGDERPRRDERRHHQNKRRSRSPGGRPRSPRRRSRSPERRSRPSPRARSPPASSGRPQSSRGGASRRDGGSFKMADKDRDQRLAEMVANATWRDEQRAKNVQRYKEEDQKAEEKNSREHDPEFLSKHLRTAAQNSSVEKRLQANRYNIQRGANMMNDNFVRK